ncbi:hypothetical protein ASPZODRAFT_124969 [Penicilliopsis zonata CBS 506.65]|uniref:FAD-binding PCMH-type domain-containing protein n=1 Tax=Penicilliopsis zonata CBS 506.65 TaxID=1073090 RepID=A0A1L9S669_9EURO|nr:hypothetical protein ASPZODRAFT_124969 [Penicilliopsis zonata CBS 506.65]OJJ42640.1 hypothetical protein ASPZODRAFT_124969 [Penicilliopsis zonata CBS 506.65]
MLFTLILLALALTSSVKTNTDCKCFPGDDCWPSLSEWSALNTTVDGRLIATVPIGTPCHSPDYNATECAYLRSEWLLPTIHYNSSSSVMAPLFANDSCDPWQPISRPCRLGNYVQYAVNASGPGDVTAALQFATKHNIRFVIRNTGHDYNGRSTGAGALSVWTHHLKETEVLSWSDGGYYTGPAMKFGAGVQGFDALKAAYDAGFSVLTGECPSVGIVGGYVQGGGHSALSTIYGLAADNTLSFEVVLPNGTLITASRERNVDLFWALSGGGPGNYGVVLSMTTKVFPDATVSGAEFTITAPNSDTDAMYAVVDAFHDALPGIVDQGVMIIYYFGAGYIKSPAITVYNKTAGEVAAILQPFIDSVASLGIEVKPNYTQFSSYYDHYNHYWGPLPEGNIQVGVSLFGGRLIPRSAIAGFSSISRAMIDLGVTFIGVGLDVSRFGGDNAVLPAWRDAIVSASLTYDYSFTLPFADMWERQDNITRIVQPLIEAATPGSGAYMNEADFQQPDFQQVFYGDNYPDLLAIKKKYDPQGLLYGITAVGSEEWVVHQDGRMCRS